MLGTFGPLAACTLDPRPSHHLNSWCYRAVLFIQSQLRMVRCRREFLRQRRAAVHIQAAVRGLAARRAYSLLRLQSYAATIIQAHQRGIVARKGYKRSRDAVIAIQMGQRRWKVLLYPIIIFPVPCSGSYCMLAYFSYASDALTPGRHSVKLNAGVESDAALSLVQQRS